MGTFDNSTNLDLDYKAIFRLLHQSYHCILKLDYHVLK